MDPLAIVRRRLHDQRLAADPLETPEAVVGWLGAAQAQEFAEAKWSVGQRLRGGTDARVDRALDSGAIIRTHVLRPTWHFVTAADIRWLLRLTAPRVHQLNQYWYRKLALDEKVLARGHEVLSRELSGGAARTRRELAAALGEAGIAADGLRLGNLLMHAELEQLVCSGPRRGRQHTYAMFDERVEQAEDRPGEQALAELCLRFFRSHGPATVADLTNWSSLTVADAKTGLATLDGELDTRVDDDGTTWWAAPGSATEPPGTGAFLIPMYDETVVAYKGLRVVLAEAPPRTGLLERPIVIDGYTVGSWKRRVSTRAAVIEATLFTTLDATQRQALEAATERFGRFLGLPATLESLAAG